MAEPIIIYGKSGCGKSRSLVDFADDEIMLVNVTGKRLPVKKNFKYSIVSDDFEKIKKAMIRASEIGLNICVIDDAGYLMTSLFMSKHSAPQRGASTFDLFNEIADSFWQLMIFIRYNLPADMRVYLIMHEISNDYGETKIRTIGKLLDEKVCVEGLATVCIHALEKNGDYFFKVNATREYGGDDVAKSPEGMFDEPILENSLKKVDDLFCKYYEINNNKGDNE